MADTTPREDFLWVPTEEPHASRRKAILKAHPEVSRLQGPEWRTKWICLAVVVLHMGLGVVSRSLSWPVWLAVVYWP